MQSELPKLHDNESYRAFEFSHFIQENWVYLGIVLIMIYIVVMYAKIVKDRKKNKDN
jgi:uncharacterized membrane protein SirB2